MDPRHTLVNTPLGDVTLVASDDSMTGLYFHRHWYRPAQHTFGHHVSVSADPLLATAWRQLDEYLSGARTSFDLPATTRGDRLQEQVWALLKDIPFGETTTYGALAEQLGDRTLAQSVGKAIGRNPLCVIVPCHRVVGKDGKLTGYAGGLERKRFLLDVEKSVLATAGNPS